MLFAPDVSSAVRMHHMTQMQLESGSNQPLNLSRGPSKLKAKLSARHHRATMSAAGARSPPTSSSASPSPTSSPPPRTITIKSESRLHGSSPHNHHGHMHHHHHYHHHHLDRERAASCSCPQQDSKNTILYRLLTDSYTAYWTPVCCIGGKCHDGQIMGQSKLKILLEESKRQAVQ